MMPEVTGYVSFGRNVPKNMEGHMPTPVTFWGVIFMWTRIPLPHNTTNWYYMSIATLNICLDTI